MPITLFHGSDKIVEKPVFGKGNRFNDYGLGFYTTPHFDLAAEWAVPMADADGYVNRYSLTTDGLAFLDLDNEPIEHWITVLIKNRGGRFSKVVRERMAKFSGIFPFDICSYDIVKGWRADDAYFSFIRDFFDVGLSLENLKKAMELGELGTQYCIMSERAFDRLGFVEPAAKISAAKYHPLRLSRDSKARTDYENMPCLTKGMNIFDIVGRD